MKDWYNYITKEFKLDKSVYRVSHRVPVTCPSCSQSKVERLNHVKRKIKDLGYYECSKCRKSKSLIKARAIKKQKASE